MKKIILGMLVLIGTVFSLSQPVGATINSGIQIQDREYGFAVSPATVDFDIVPGETTSDTIRLRNTGRNEVDIKVGVTPLSVSGEDYGETNTIDFTARTEIVRWSDVSVDKGCSIFKKDKDGTVYIHLRVQEECNVRYTVNTPSNAPAGAQHMNIYFQLYEDENTAAVSGVNILQSIGVNAYGQNRQGEAVECVKVEKQHIPLWVASGALHTDYVARNCGNLDTYVESYLEVKNLFGNTVHRSYAEKDGKWKITESGQQRVVLADTSRLVDIGWEEAGMGIFRVTQTVKAGGEVFTKTRLVFLIPIWMVVAVLICLMIIVLTIVKAVKKKKKIYRRK